MTEEKCNSPSRWPTAKTEQKAVNVLINCILETDYIHPFIKDNDREPSWDGCLYLYSGPEQTKDQIVGRASVQVKGKRCASFPRGDVEKYPVELSDLRNYQVDGGAILFCVRFVGEEHRIYYAHLFPSQIQKLLANHTGKKTKTVELQRYPSDPEEQRNLLAFFLEHSKRQHVFFPREERPTNLEAILKRGNFSIIFTRFAQGESLSQFLPFADNTLCYIYDEATPEPVPCDDVFSLDEISFHLSQSVTIDNLPFFDSFVETKTPASDKTTFCAGLLTYENKRFNARFDGPLSDSIKALQFTIKALETGSFKLGRRVVNLYPKKKKSTYLSQLNERLESYQRVSETFRAFGLDANVDISCFTEDDRKAVDFLVNSSTNYIRPEHLPPTVVFSPKSEAVLSLFVGSQQVILTVKKRPSDGCYIVDDFFKKPPFAMYEYNGRPQKTTPFFLLTQKDFVNAANLDCSAVLASLRQFYEPNVAGVVNALFRQVLLAFDECEKQQRAERAAALLKMAEELNALALSKDAACVAEQINRLQIVKRKGEFDDKETNATFDILEATVSNLERFALNLLLDAKPHAQKYWRELTLDEQKDVYDWPLSRFMNKQDFPLAESPAEPSV